MDFDAKTRLLDEGGERGTNDIDQECDQRSASLRQNNSLLSKIRQRGLYVSLVAALLVAVIIMFTAVLGPATSRSMKSLSHLVIIGDSYSGKYDKSKNIKAETNSCLRFKVDGCEAYMEGTEAAQFLSQNQVPRCPPLLENRTQPFWYHSWVQYLQYDQDHSTPGKPSNGRFEIISMAKHGAVCSKDIFKNLPLDSKQQFDKFKTLYTNFNNAQGKMPFPVDSSALVRTNAANASTSFRLTSFFTGDLLRRQRHDLHHGWKRFCQRPGGLHDVCSRGRL